MTDNITPTQEQQSETIHTLSRLLAGAEEAAIERAEQIERLRREVAAFRDKMTESAEQYEALYNRDRDLEHFLAAEYDRQIVCALTRILEGEE